MATKPSLALIPSGYKASKVYSVLPSNGDGDFTFTRSGAATRVNAQGLIETVDANTPRLNYPLIDGEVSGCPSLLLEPSRTNKITHSEEFSNSSWLKSDMTVTSDNIISPYGTQSADKIEATGNGSVRTSSQYAVTNGYSFSIFVKKGNSRYITLRSFAFTTSVIIGFDLESKTAQTGGVIEEYPNDWYRLSISKYVFSDADKQGYFYMYLPNSLGSTSTVSGNYAYFFGCQLEDATYPTSYIPTSGQTNGVTRSAETANGAGDAATFNDSEGVLYVEISALDDDKTFRILALSNNTATDHIRIYYTNNSNTISILVRSGGVNQYTFLNYNVNNITEYTRIAVKYKDSDFATFLNGFKINSKTDGGISPIGLDRLNFDNGIGGSDFYGNTKDLRVYNTVLTDVEFEDLTSWDSFSEMATAQLYTIQ